MTATLTPDRIETVSPTAVAWGVCSMCRLPGLSLVRWWTEPTPGMPRCGFCGGQLVRVEADLTALAEWVIAAPLKSIGNGS